MRKLKLQVQMSVDGYIAGPKGEMDWMLWNWDDALVQYVKEITDPIDCIVLGRKLAEGFIPHWAAVAANTDDSQNDAGRKFTDTDKIVFSKTLNEQDALANGWNNTIITNDDLVQEIASIKNKDGKDIIAYGGAKFVSDLIKHGLIDEFHFFINPTLIGNGMPIFREVDTMQNLALVKSTSFDCGIVVLHYALKQT
ncbi:MAG: dihydrofolate reductase family protein [Ginsengibacter sp.]